MDSTKMHYSEQLTRTCKQYFPQHYPNCFGFKAKNSYSFAQAAATSPGWFRPVTQILFFLLALYIQMNINKQTKNGTRNVEISNCTQKAQGKYLTSYLKTEQNEFGTWQSIASANKLY